MTRGPCPSLTSLRQARLSRTTSARARWVGPHRLAALHCLPSINDLYACSCCTHYRKVVCVVSQRCALHKWTDWMAPRLGELPCCCFTFCFNVPPAPLDRPPAANLALRRPTGFRLFCFAALSVRSPSRCPHDNRSTARDCRQAVGPFAPSWQPGHAMHVCTHTLSSLTSYTPCPIVCRAPPLQATAGCCQRWRA